MRLSRYILFPVTMAAILVSPQLGFANSGFSFPSCVNIGNRNADIFYSDGIHGIAGDTNTYIGSDSVYKLDGNNQVLQCFCGKNGQGIQTNWIRTDRLPDPNTASLKQQGWIFVPYGSDWGLDDTTYLAQNITYACLGTATVQSAVATSTSSSNNTSSSSPSVDNALVQLANTGNSLVLTFALLLGLVTMVSGIVVYPKK